MAAYLLDINHLSPLVTLGHPLREKVLHRMASGDVFAVAAPTLTETLFGISLLPRMMQNRAEWARLQAGFGFYEVLRSDAELAADLQIALRRRGWQLETVDALTASIALRNDLTLLTTDQDFSGLPQLRQENWLKDK